MATSPKHTNPEGKEPERRSTLGESTNEHIDAVELLCTSNFSFLKGASHPEELVEQAASLGYKAIGICDECSLAGIVRAHLAAKQHNIQLIVGARFTLSKSCEFAGQQIAMLVRNALGYSHLCRLITQARSRSVKSDYSLVREDLADAPPGLIVIVVAQEHNKAQLPALLNWFNKRLTGRVHLACQLGHSGYDRNWLMYLHTLSSVHGTPIVASAMPLMHHAQRKPLLDILKAISLNSSLSEATAWLEPNAQKRLLTQIEWETQYPPALRAHALSLAQSCEFSLDELRYQYPREITPPNASPAAHLKQLVSEGALARYPNGVPAPIVQQIEYELQLIGELGYEPYFLTVYDLVKFARQRNILCQGRGSAANSVVCYCLGITEVDPAQMSVLFERFISKERNEPPDIDVDFEHSRREEVIQYIYHKYGRHRAALAAAVVVYRPRSAIRDAGKALGLPTDTIDALAKSQDGGYSRDINTDHIRAAGLDPQEPTIMRCVHFANELLRFPRHLSQHTGGFVIARDNLNQLVPVENAAMPERTVIQWDKDDLDAMGLLKIDVLALGMLSAIRMTLDCLKTKPLAPRRIQDIPKEDPATYNMISQADTVGVFQIESRAQMGMLPRLRPREFYDLVIQVAIVRPGPIQGGMVHPYLKRRQGLLPVEYPSDALRTALGRTLGVPIFQEQVMQIAILAAGFTPGEADQLRRGMAAWKRRGGLAMFYERVVGGMVERGYSKEFAENIFKQIEGFGEYGFPESHAASFAALVYVSAWLKCHHPDAYLCGLLNAQPMGFYAPAQLIQDAQRHGVHIEPVDVQRSDTQCFLEAPEVAQQSRHTGTAHTTPHTTLYPVRLGLNQVVGLSQAGAERIVQARQAGSFRSVEDLCKRAHLDKRDTLALADANALRSLASHRRQAAWQTAGLQISRDLLHDTRTEETPVDLPEPSQLEDMLADYRSTRASLEHHPISFIREQLKAFRITTINQCHTFPDRRLARACGVVTHRQRPATAKGTVFVNLEDETGNVNVIIWRDLAEQSRHVLRTAQIMGVFGIWQKADGVSNLLARKIVDFTPLLTELTWVSRDFK